MAYRRQWFVLVSGFFEPLFYLLSIGIGLNKLIHPFHIHGVVVTYAVFVAPGMLATSAMNGAVIDSLYNTFFKLKVSHVYEPVLATPLDVNDVALGEVLWSVTRGFLYSGSFILCMVLLGDYHSAWVVLCLPGAVISSFAFACVGLAGCTWMRSWQDFDMVALVQMPLFLFSATFFPLYVYPKWLATIVVFSPLYQSATMLRGFALGTITWQTWGHLAYLVVMGAAGLWVAGRRFRKILAP